MKIVSRLGVGLIAGGLALMGYCAFTIVDAWVLQRRYGIELEGRVEPARLDPKAVTGDLIGRIEIVRLGLSAVIVEGSDRLSLRRGVGHIPTTALPGQSGNVGLAGHRDTFFRPLRAVRPTDIIVLTTPRGTYRYRVVSTRVVGPREVSVLRPSEAEVLTLVTCFPFDFLGSAPSRFIVRAERIETRTSCSLPIDAGRRVMGASTWPRRRRSS